MSGYVGDLSAQQEEILNKFRENLQDVMKPDYDDHYLLRWLRARDFDLKKAEAMLRDALAWRQQIGADTILTDYQPIDVIEKFRTGGIVGLDKEGCPIYVDPYGLVDLKGLLHCVKKQDIVRKYVEVMETLLQMCKEESVKRNKVINEVGVVYDLNKIGLRHLWKPAVDVYLTLVKVCEMRYPETLKFVAVINAPKFMPVIWSLVKPLLHEATVKKVRIFGGHYKDFLLKHIDPEVLPMNYGGTRTDPDGNPRCINTVKQGGMIPKEYYNQAEPDIKMTTASIKRGSTLHLEYQIDLPNSLLRWEFQTEGYDIGFGIYKRTMNCHQKASEMKEMLKTERANSQLVPEDGILECEETGTYVVRFDNSYSWARAKKVHYLIEVLEPKDKIEKEDEDDNDEEYAMANEDINREDE